MIARVGGRSERDELIVQLHRSGLSVRAIAAQVGLSRSQVHNVVTAAHRLSSPVMVDDDDDGAGTDGDRPAGDYALAAFRLTYVDEDIRAVWMADLAAEQRAVIGGDRQAAVLPRHQGPAGGDSGAGGSAGVLVGVDTRLAGTARRRR
jgi:hypothetical protein